ncbi:Glycosyl transferase family 2 [Agreia sp. VKM Ac-1783]|nr:Glycosyl transferase family 2 [Agreia sp. VKM Ac-1783]
MVSVCMASYRGEKYIAEQVTSILRQLDADDELVIVDDASPDATVDVVQAIGDPRIRIERNAVNQGYVRGFERAVGLARGEFVLLADQDDVWTSGRVDAMVTALADAKVVAGNYSVLGENGRIPARWPLTAEQSHRELANEFGILVGYRPYFGCAMGMRRDAVDDFLPVPAYFTESHDLWLAIVGNATRSIRHLPRVVVERRLHDANATPLRWRGIGQILRARIMIARGLIEARRRKRS